MVLARPVGARDAWSTGHIDSRISRTSSTLTRADRLFLNHPGLAARISREKLAKSARLSCTQGLRRSLPFSDRPAPILVRAGGPAPSSGSLLAARLERCSVGRENREAWRQAVQSRNPLRRSSGRHLKGRVERRHIVRPSRLIQISSVIYAAAMRDRHHRAGSIIRK